jgi:predicted SAM-dependent methyltransferase
MSANGQFSWRRNPLSYSRLHVLVNDRLRLASLWRNRTMFVNRKRLRGLRYLNVGPGYSVRDDFVNLDYRWHPGIDVTWDIENIRRHPYPFPEESFTGIYTEHCLEHISISACTDNLREFHRLLEPGGVVRIIVPDGELYIDWYNRHRRGEPVEVYRAKELNEPTPMWSLNRIAHFVHRFLYDYETLAWLLRNAGFADVRRECFGRGSHPKLLLDSESHKAESLYVEATK